VKISELLSLLDSISPFELQEKWDNSGLLVGSLSSEVNNIYLSLDIDSNLINNIEENSLIITHHPLIFKPISNIILEEFPSKLIIEMVKKNISLISLHTNFDKTHLNKFVLEDILEYKSLSQNEFSIEFEVNQSFEDFCKDISNKLNIKNLRVVKNTDFIKNCTITTGSGASLLSKTKTDCFITGDIKYHDAMLAKELGISMIDICHYESEIHFATIMKKELDKLNIKAKILNTENPFNFI
jgi:dinuclear metal center YbgI/SA1388 family protein